MFVVMIVVAGCGGSKSATSEKTPKDTLVVGLPVDLASIDPAVAMDNKAWKVSYPATNDSFNTRKQLTVKLVPKLVLPLQNHGLSAMMV